MENLTKQEIDYSIAKERVQQLKKFYAGMAIFILVFAIYSIRRYYLTGEIVFLEQHNVSVIFWIWGIILAIKGVKLFFFNHDWERRMVQKQLKQNENGNY